MLKDSILILDFGSQTTHLIGRRLRDLGAKIIILNPETPLAQIRKLNPAGIILSGGPSSVYLNNSPTVDPQIFTLKIPVLGICYGWQLMAEILGGKVSPCQKEYGPQILTLTNNSPLFDRLPKQFKVWVSHGDTVIKLPEKFEPTARTENVALAAAADSSGKLYGVQFHPEVEHTRYGPEILKNFLTLICHYKLARKTQITRQTVSKIIEDIKNKIGDGKAVCAVSGGVDSTVAACLAAKAIGSNLIPIHIANGLMRRGTDREVQEIFRTLKAKPIIINAERLFLKKLKGVTNYRKKRKIIGNLYIKLFEAEAKKIKGVRFLIQGTLYSDFIESRGTKHSSNIRYHHNVSGLPVKMNLKLVEPLRDYYKDEVRKIGRLLNLPDNFISKQPFPGPGQAIRIMGKVTPQRLKIQQRADEILMEEIKRAKLYKKVFQSFTVMTGAKSTAVRGDLSFIGEVVALRVYQSKDIMTGDWANLPRKFLQSVSSRITNEVPGISRVVYDITTKPPATMEWE